MVRIIVLLDLLILSKDLEHLYLFQTDCIGLGSSISRHIFGSVKRFLGDGIILSVLVWIHRIGQSITAIGLPFVFSMGRWDYYIYPRLLCWSIVVVVRWCDAGFRQRSNPCVNDCSYLLRLYKLGDIYCDRQNQSVSLLIYRQPTVR